jgi:hypothetical protein
MKISNFNIPSFTVGAMIDLLNSKTIDEVIMFFTNQGYNEDDNDTDVIFESIRALTDECIFCGVNVNFAVFDNFDRKRIDTEYGLGSYPYWMIYMTEGDTQMLVLAGRGVDSKEVLEKFIGCCDRDVMIVTSWK